MSTKIVNKASKVGITVPSEGHFLLLFRKTSFHQCTQYTSHIET